jgi:transcriptional regulator with XRE-family HTH domain
MKKETAISGFSKRLATLRKAKGLTQQQLADIINVSRRVIAYYEAESDNPPGYLIVQFSKALEVSADELLGIKTVKNSDAHQASLKIIRRMKKIESLPAAEQKFILKAIDSHIKAIEK